MHDSLRWIAAARKLFPLVEPGPLAAPWARLLSAAIDTVLIFLLHVAIVGYSICTWGTNDTVEMAETIGSPVLCWLYVLIGWTLGATIGMRLCGIKIVTESFGKPNTLVALKRMGGFMLACLPVKAGLLPIFFDERRQGWHDRIAGTLVVKHGATVTDAVPARRAPEVLTKAPQPDFREPWRASWIALPLYIALAVGITWPTAAHMSTRIMGEAADPYIFIWNYWYFLYAIQTHHSILHTNLIFYPHTLSLSLHTMQWLNCLLAAPLQHWLNLTATYNLLNIGSLASSAFCSYWCVASISRNRFAALICGVLLGMSPYFMAHALGHANLIAAEFLPLYALCLYGAVVTYRIRYALWAGVWMGLAGLCDLQYLAFTALFAIVLLVGLYLLYERPDRNHLFHQLALVATGLLVAATLLLPVIAPAIGQMGGHAVDKSGASAMFRVDLTDWVTPGIGSRLLGQNFKDHLRVEQSVTPGYTFLLLGLIGMVLSWKRARLWAWVALCFGVLACGPYLTIHGVGLSAVPFLLFGFPGVGFGLPWQTDSMVYLGGVVVTDPKMLFADSLRIAMPFAWLPKVIPLLKPFRVPARFGVLVLLSFSILSSIGLSSLWERFWARSKALTGTATLLICLAIATEFYCLPYPTFVPPTFRQYEVLSHDPGHLAVIEEPFRGNETSAYGQVVHHKPLFKSFISRVPAGALDLTYRNDFLIHFTKCDIALGPGATKRSVNELKKLGAGYIAMRLDGAEHCTASDCDTIERLLGIHPAYADESMKIYRLSDMR